VGYHGKRMLGRAGYLNGYGYTTNKGGSNVFMNTTANIGLAEDSAIPVERVERSWADSNADFSVAAGDDFLTKLAASPRPDIVILGFYQKFDSASGQVLADYVNAGGVVILQCEDIDSDNIANVVRKVTGLTALSDNNMGSAGTVYPLATAAGTNQYPAADDPIMAGPFGNLFGRTWGEDASTTLGINNFSSSATATVYSRGSSAYTTGYVTMFRWRGKGFFYVGDGGFISQNQRTSISSTIEPFWIDGAGKPITNTRYSGGKVENARIFANTMYWAIDYAEFYGINKKTETTAAEALYKSEWGKDKSK